MWAVRVWGNKQVSLLGPSEGGPDFGDVHGASGRLRLRDASEALSAHLSLCLPSTDISCSVPKFFQNWAFALVRPHPGARSPRANPEAFRGGRTRAQSG